MHKLAKFSANPGKIYFEGLVHLLGYIRENNTLGLKYDENMNDALVSELLIQASIKTENKLMDFSYSSRKDFPETGRSTRAYLSFAVHKFTKISSNPDKAHFMMLNN